MKIYIAGKISGDPTYKGKFAAEARRLERAGNIVLNPAVLPEGLTPEDYMRICFAMIESADIVHFLPDAGESEGAKLEKAYCKYIKKAWEDASTYE